MKRWIWVLAIAGCGFFADDSEMAEVTVVDSAGAIIGHARVGHVNFLEKPGFYSLPGRELRAGVDVAARGYRTQHLRTNDLAPTVTLERGIPVRIELPEGIPGPESYAIVVEIERVGADRHEESYIALAKPRVDITVELPFFMVKGERAIDLLVPEPGDYWIKWSAGSLDINHSPGRTVVKSSTTTPAGVARMRITVEDTDETQTVVLNVEKEHLD